jgi:hypothetical protein
MNGVGSAMLKTTISLNLFLCFKLYYLKIQVIDSKITNSTLPLLRKARL